MQVASSARHLLSAAVLLLLVGCGQKGPLYQNAGANAPDNSQTSAWAAEPARR